MSGNKSFRKSQLIAFENVAAGHDGVLSDPSGELVFKPCKQSEVDFYESASAHPELHSHIPGFFGTINLNEKATQKKLLNETFTLGPDIITAQTSETLVLPDDARIDIPAASGIGSTTVIANDWAPSNGGKIQTDLAIVLENVAHGYKKPNILDVKLGARLWADDAPPSKKARLDKIAQETTSGPLGFRIAGMRTYQGGSAHAGDEIASTGYKLFDKSYGRKFTVKDIDEGFGDYFLLGKEERASGQVRKVIKLFIKDLEVIQEVFEKSESRMYSASLLFVYEGDGRALQDAFAAKRDARDPSEVRVSDGKTNGGVVPSDGNDEDFEEDVDDANLPAIQSLKLIDFAHAEWVPGQGPDQNLLHGIRSVIKVLHEIV